MPHKMTTERIIATLAIDTGYSFTTVRRWWARAHVRSRTARELAAAAKKHKLHRPRIEQ